MSDYRTANNGLIRAYYYASPADREAGTKTFLDPPLYVRDLNDKLLDAFNDETLTPLRQAQQAELKKYDEAMNVAVEAAKDEKRTEPVEAPDTNALVAASDAVDVAILTAFASDGNGEAFDNFQTVEKWLEIGHDERDAIMTAVRETRAGMGKRMEQNRTSRPSSADGSGATAQT